VGPSVITVGWQIWGTSEVATKVPVAPESRIAVGKTVGGTTTGLNERVFSNLFGPVVPPRQVGTSQKQLLVLPPIMSLKVADS